MARTIFLLATLAASISLGAQQPMSPNQVQGNPPAVVNVNPPPTVVVAGSGLYGPSVFMTPTASFATPQPAAGATQTGYVSGAAGVSLNTSPYLGVTSTLGPAPLVYEGGQPGYAYAAGGAVSGGGVEAGAPSGRLINDMGPSYYATVVEPPPKVSLGEVAASYRAVPLHPVRVFANAPAEELEHTYVVTGAAIASNVTPEKIIVPQSAQNAPPQTQAQQAPAPRAPESQLMAENMVPPPIAPPAQAETKQEPSSLPATSTLLPLFALLGLAGGGLGVWLLRARR
jgi:hypothetical protein